MRFSIVAFTLLVAAASAFAVNLIARQQSYPSCSVPCLTGGPIGNCTVSDIKCLCSNKVFVDNTTTCIQNSCQGSDYDTAVSLALENCKKVGISLTSSTSPPSPSSTNSTTTTSGASQNNLDSFLVLGAAAFAAFSL